MIESPIVLFLLLFTKKLGANTRSPLSPSRDSQTGALLETSRVAHALQLSPPCPADAHTLRLLLQEEEAAKATAAFHQPVVFTQYTAVA